MTSGYGAFNLLLPLLMLLVAILGQLGASGRLTRNHFVGIRLPSTLANDEAWRSGHRAAARPAWMCFAAMTIVAIVSFTSIGPNAAIACTAVIGGIFVVAIVWIVVAAGAAARGDR